MKNTLSLSLLTTILFLILIATPVFAQDATTEEMRVTSATQVDADAYAGATKGEFLYTVDRTWEEVQRVFITDEARKAEFSEKLYKERLAEAQVLLSDQKEEELQKTLELYMQEFGTATSIVARSNDMSEEEKAIYQMKLGEDATRNLAILNEIKEQSESNNYFIGLVEAKTIDHQLQIVSAIATYDTATASRIFEEALELKVRAITEEADNISEGGKMSDLDDSIQNLNQYVAYSSQFNTRLSEGERLTTGTRIMQAADDSVARVTDVLGATRTATSINNSIGSRDGAEYGVKLEPGCTVPNPNIYGTVTADTGAPVCDQDNSRVNNTSINFGAPAYQSNSGGISWQEYILTR